MNVELPPDQRAFVQPAIDSGRFSHAEEAVREALALWEEREHRRIEIISMIDEADASLARGEGRVFTKESTPVLVDEIKQRLRRRLQPRRGSQALTASGVESCKVHPSVFRQAAVPDSEALRLALRSATVTRAIDAEI